MRKMMLALLATVALVGAGCGGDDEEAEALTKAEFIEQGNAICAEGNKEIEAAAQEFPDEPSESEVETFASDTLVPNIQEQIDGLRDLGPPEGDEDTVEEITSSAQEALDQVDEDPQLLLSSDDPFNEANDLAEEYGLEECAG